MQLLRSAVLLAIVLSIGGCAIGYYTQSVIGHLKLMSRREPIERLNAHGFREASRLRYQHCEL